MSVVYVLLPVAVCLAAAGVAAFIWSVHQGQFDDMETPAVRMLHDDEDRGDEGPASRAGPGR
jgi:cbb3-type cytochrome oxidase maturation protein